MNTPTLSKFISTALIPVGHTMYVYGGGWDETDTKGGVNSIRIGEADIWKTFFTLQTSSYNHENYLHCTTLGLDCTGYIGWCIYNLLNTESGGEPYVYPSAVLGYRLMERGLGNIISNKSHHRCGDIFFSPKHHHAYISLGKCNDGSVVLIHSSPPGVMISGTEVVRGCESEAQKFATLFMHSNFPHWSIKFPDSNRPDSYMKDYLCFRFSEKIVHDPHKIAMLSPSEILQFLKSSP